MIGLTPFRIAKVTGFASAGLFVLFLVAWRSLLYFDAKYEGPYMGWLLMVLGVLGAAIITASVSVGAVVIGIFRGRRTRA